MFYAYMVKNLTVLDKIALVLVIIGGLNWGLVGFFQWNLVEFILGFSATGAFLAQLVYLLVGVAAIYVAVVMMKFARR